ncbi:MAG: glycogen/starch synthase [Bacteroidota bacterium]
MEKKKILFISQEIFPFSPKSEISSTSRRLPEIIQDAGKEIRVFMPRFGCINERRHQLHEVIRLSGQNLTIDDNDHQLIIKVASVSPARMQVYFIDNDELFRRNGALGDVEGQFYNDNDERSIFFCRGVLETVKKLGWQPDIIHCNGWLSSMMALYIKFVYDKDPHFSNTKVVYNIFDQVFTTPWDKRLPEKLLFDGIPSNVASKFSDTSCVGITKALAKYIDGLCIGSESIPAELLDVFNNSKCPKLGYIAEENQAKELSAFFDKIIDESVLV